MSRVATYRTLIDAAALHDLLDRGEALVVDCGFDLTRPEAGREAYRASHIPGARYLHLDHDLAATAGPRGRHPLPDPQTFAATMRRIGLHRGQQVVAYDDAGGAYAARLWWLLRWLGHDAVAVLDGGRRAWSDSGYPLEAGIVTSHEGDFAGAEPDRARVIDADQLVADLPSGAWLVVDARSPDRFAGRPDPLDPVPGHIPGARNRFFKDNLDADGRFRPAAALAADFGQVLRGHPAQGVVLQCGSGVTACHNALAMAVAGLPEPRLYPGSWSEWSLDPARPIARG